MNRIFAGASILGCTLLAGGCATKKYVHQTTAPIQAKLDQVADQTTKQGQAIEQTRTDLKGVDDRAQSGISAAKEQAMTAQNSAASAQNAAKDAMTKATQASDLAAKDSEEISSLRHVVANLDDYKMTSNVTIPFGFNKYTLSPDDMRQLDDLAAGIGKAKRYFVAVEGYTDKVGAKEYNEALSKRRADSVVSYLVGSHNVPVYRIHMIGLGDQKPVDDGGSRAARAKNRRVEVKVFTADQNVAMLPQSTTQAQR